MPRSDWSTWWSQFCPDRLTKLWWALSHSSTRLSHHMAFFSCPFSWWWDFAIGWACPHLIRDRWEFRGGTFHTASWFWDFRSNGSDRTNFDWPKISIYWFCYLCYLILTIRENRPGVNSKIRDEEWQIFLYWPRPAWENFVRQVGRWCQDQRSRRSV